MEEKKLNNPSVQCQFPWHAVEEVPERFRELVLFCKDGHLFAPNYAPSAERWRFICIITQTVLWAYSDDLKPVKSSNQ